MITIYARLNQVRDFENLEELQILKLSEKVDPPNIAGAITDSKVSYVHNAYNLDSAFTGVGVLLGIIDGGFDYTHPNFYNDNFDKYRVVAAWDQRTPGSPPEGFEFGSLYDSEELLLEAKRDSEDIEEHWGTHGTHVAGNNGAGDFHLSHEFSTDTIRTNITKSGGHYWGNRIVMIGEQDKQFGISLEFRDLSDNTILLDETQFFRSNDQINSIDTSIVVDGDTISYRLLLEDEDPFSGRSRIDLFIENEGIHKSVIKAYSEDATVHFWNVAERETRTTNRVIDLPL